MNQTIKKGEKQIKDMYFHNQIDLGQDKLMKTCKLNEILNKFPNITTKKNSIKQNNHRYQKN